MGKQLYYLVGGAVLWVAVLWGYSTLRSNPANDATAVTDMPSPTAQAIDAINLYLTPGNPPPPSTGRIGGIVTDMQNHTLADLRVVLHQMAYDVSGISYWQDLATTKTAVDGAYTFAELPPNTYRVGFFDDNQPPRFLPEYYNHAANPDIATDIALTVGTIITDINVQMAKPSTITGRVTDRNGNPLKGIQATIYSDQVQNLVINRTTDSAGVYTVSGLAAGTYRLTFYDPFDLPRYNAIAYSNVISIEDATPVIVGTEESVTGIDILLAATSRLTGIVTDQQAHPLANIKVTVYHNWDLEGTYMLANASTTDATGAYTVSGLPVGWYRVGFADANRPPQYATTYYTNTATVAEATIISVTEEATISGINAQLARTP